MTYYLYHIPGKKIGITKDLKKRVEEQQGYSEGEYDIILETDDINIISEAEWQWYLSGDPCIDALGEIYGKVPEIWKRMANEHGRVNSNYGWQWQRSYDGVSQLDSVIKTLKDNPESRQAAISIYDCKEQHRYDNDTPCTYAVQFTIVHNRLDMCVTMRSNDLWYGFCNDQYQFSKLQEMVSKRLRIETGVYYHFAHNMHLYNNKI